MAEGIVLGAVPLILYAIDNYNRCLKPFKDYNNYSYSLEKIKDEIFLQQKQFDITMRSLGLDRPSYTELEQRLQLYYPQEHTRFMSVIQSMNQIANEIVQHLCLDAQGKPDWSEDNLPRIAWEWRRIERSFTSKLRQDKFAELQRYNDALSRCLEKPEIPAEDTSPRVEAQKALYNPQNCDKVRNHAIKVSKAFDAGLQCGCVRHQMTIDLGWHESHPTRTPLFDISLLHTISQTSQTWRRVQAMIELNSADDTGVDYATVLGERNTETVTNDTCLPKSNASTKRKKHGFFELGKWVSKALTRPNPGSLKTASPVSYQARPPPATQIQSLCTYVQNLKDDSESAGFLTIPGDTERIKVTHSPGASILSSRILPLRAFLRPYRPEVHMRFSRRKRFECATSAAWALLLLCGTPWLNEDFDQDEFYFFLEGRSQATEVLARNPCLPFVHHGASCTAPQPTAASEKRFHGPFIRNRAIFALGILLMELCLNKTFDELRREQYPNNNSPSSTSDLEIADDFILEVWTEGGELYGNACQRCIRCEFSGRDSMKSFDVSQFRKEFYNVVVAPLQVTLDLTPP